MRSSAPRGVVELRRRALLRQHLVEAEHGQKPVEIGDGQLKLAVEPARRRQAQHAVRDRNGVALLHARLHDLDPAAGGLKLAQPLLPGLRREVPRAPGPPR